MHLAHLGGGGASIHPEGGWLGTQSVQDKAGKVTELPPVTMNFGGGSAS